MPSSRFILLILVFVHILWAGRLDAQINVDSLRRARKEPVHDTIKIRIDLRLAQALENTHFDSARFYYDRALQLAQSNQMEQYPFFAGLVLENIGFAHIYSKGEALEGISFLKQAFASHKAKGLMSDANKTEYNMGFFYAHYSYYDSAIFHYNEVIRRHEGLATIDRLHESYNNAGIIYFYKGQYANSARYLTTAIKLKEELKETQEIENSYMNLGLTYSSLGVFARAKEYYNKSNVIQKERGNKDAVAVGYRNIAMVLVDQDSLDEAERFLKRAFELNQETGNQVAISMDHNDMGSLFLARGNLEKALESYEEATRIIGDNVNDRYGSSLMISLGKVKLELLSRITGLSRAEKKRRLNEVIEMGEKAWRQAIRSDIINRKLSAAELLKNAYRVKGSYQMSLQFAYTAFVLTNAINNQSQSQAIAFAVTEYETEKIENQNALLQQTQDLQVAQLKQQNYLIYGAVIVLILILAIAIVIYRSRLKLQKANEVVQKSLSEKELLLKEIHHRVKNNLQVVSSLLDLQSRGIEDEQALATFMEGQNRVKAMALIHQKLYQNENLATIDFAEYAGQLMKELAVLLLSANSVQTSVQAQGETHFDIDTAVPLGLILNELVSNAYKYAFEGKATGGLQIEVKSLGKGRHQLTVADSGTGLPEGFDFARAKSLGLKLVRRLAKQLYGSVTIAS